MHSARSVLFLWFSAPFSTQEGRLSGSVRPCLVLQLWDKIPEWPGNELHKTLVRKYSLGVSGMLGSSTVSWQLKDVSHVKRQLQSVIYWVWYHMISHVQVNTPWSLSHSKAPLMKSLRMRLVWHTGSQWWYWVWCHVQRLRSHKERTLCSMSTVSTHRSIVLDTTCSSNTRTNLGRQNVQWKREEERRRKEKSGTRERGGKRREIIAVPPVASCM